MGKLERRVEKWVESRIGRDHMNSKERAIRLLEESLELAQVEGITMEQAGAQLAYVYARPKGDPTQEAGGVAVCLLGYCAARGLDLIEDVAIPEILRIEVKPVSEIRGSLARKADADLVFFAEGK